MNNLAKDTATLSAGLFMRAVINHGFDYVLYPVVLLWLGNTIGGIVLTILAVIINIAIIKAYDWSKTDWLLIEKLKDLRDRDDHSGWKAHLFSIIRKNKVAMFFILCIDDPVTVTLYFRKGSYQYNGMTKSDWGIFILSNIVSNFYWIVGWVLIIELVKKVLQLFI